MNKWYCILAIWLVSSSVLWAQQENQYTQFMHYRQGINPAYAGNSGAVEFTGLVRSQWMGIEGSPQTQVLSFSMPAVNNRVGLGANILHQSIGVTNEYTLETAYAYRFPVPRGFLGIGIMASVRMLRVDFSALQGTQPIGLDEAVPGDIQSKLVPNFGAGIYYSGQNFYFGASLPRLLESNIDLSDGDGTISRDVRHFYLMGGVELEVTDGLTLEPQLLLKFVAGAPLDMDLNVMGHFGDRFRTGLSFRLGGSTEGGFGESASLLVGADITEQLMLGLAYDMTLSQLRDFSSGSVEVVMRYYLKRKIETKPEEPDNPRFFD